MTIEEIIKKYKTNSKLSKADKDQYKFLLDHLFNLGDFDSNLIDALMDGPGEDAMWVLAHRSICSGESGGRVCFDMFLDSPRYKDNRSGTSAQKLVYLLDAFIEYGEPAYEFSLKTLTEFCLMSKKIDDSGFNKKASALFESIIIEPKIDKLEQIPFGDINKRIWYSVRDFFKWFVNEFGHCAKLAKPRIFDWLNSSGLDMGGFSNPISDDGKTDSAPAADQEAGAQQTGPVPVQDILKKIIFVIKGQASILEKHNTQIEKLSEKLNNILKINSDLQKELDASKSQARNLSVRLQDEVAENITLRKMIKELQEAIEKLQSKISETEQFSNTVVLNRKMQADAANRKLASALSLDYRDFLDAKEVEMTIELGENMRSQLESVFQILKENEITMK